jgi:hypothetical protein
MWAQILSANFDTVSRMARLQRSRDHEKNQRARAIGMAPKSQRMLIANSAAIDRRGVAPCMVLILAELC